MAPVSRPGKPSVCMPASSSTCETKPEHFGAIAKALGRDDVVADAAAD